VARFSWVSLDVTLTRTEARKFGAPIPVMFHSGAIPHRVSGGRFPLGELSDACSWAVASL